MRMDSKKINKLCATSITVLFLAIIQNSICYSDMLGISQPNCVTKTYCLSTFGTKMNAREIKEELLLNAKQNAASELFGELIKSKSVLKNGYISENELLTKTIGLLRIKGDPVYKNSQNFGESCVTITAYTTFKDKQNLEDLFLSQEIKLQTQERANFELKNHEKETSHIYEIDKKKSLTNRLFFASNIQLDFYLGKPFVVYNNFSNRNSINLENQFLGGLKILIDNFGIEIGTVQYDAVDWVCITPIQSKAFRVNYKMETSNIHAEIFYEKYFYKKMLDLAIHIGFKWNQTRRKYSDDKHFFDNTNRLETFSYSDSFVLGLSVKKIFLERFSIFGAVNGLVGFSKGNTLLSSDTWYETSKSMKSEISDFRGIAGDIGIEYKIPKSKYSLKIGYKIVSFLKNDTMNGAFLSCNYLW